MVRYAPLSTKDIASQSINLIIQFTVGYQLMTIGHCATNVYYLPVASINPSKKDLCLKYPKLSNHPTRFNLKEEII